VLALVLYANFNLLIAFHKLVTPIFSQNNGMRAFSDWFFYTVDSLIGYLMFILMAFLSFIGVVSVLQMKLLFNDSFSENVKHAKIGRAMREQKIGVVAQAAPAGAVAGSQALTSARPSTAASAATGITVQTMVMSERRYM
jgi:1,3-beta-glucan synthase